MASSPFRSKATYHARSVSLPSRCHPLIPEFNEQLCRIRDTESTSSLLPSISNRFSGLEDLYDCVDNLLLLPQTLQAVAQQHNEKWIDEVVEGYVRLLDVCDTAKIVFSQMKQDVQDLLSTLRRRRDTNDFQGYLTSRKKLKKVIQKLRQDLKSIKNKNTLQPVTKDHEIMAIVGMLKEVEAVTLAMFETLLSYICETKLKSRQRGWSLVSKLMQHKIVVCQDEETNENEFEKVDAALNSLICQKAGKFDNKTVQNQLGKIESSIEDVEERLESLFRRLIKTRVSLLNIFNH